MTVCLTFAVKDLRSVIKDMRSSVSIWKIYYVQRPARQKMKGERKNTVASSTKDISG
jgi:hypothetical protein